MAKNIQVDLLHGSIGKGLMAFAIPIMISSVFQQLYNMVDIMIVGNILGDTALAAIGSSSPIYDLLMGFALGVGSGLSIVTARSYGGGDMEELKKSVASSLVISLGVSLLVTLIAIIGLKPFMRLLKTPEEVMDEAYTYISLITQLCVIMVFFNLLSRLLNAVGNSIAPLIFLVIASVLNVALDYLMVEVWNLGIRGAAIATVISQAISVVFCLLYILLRCPILIPSKRHFRLEKPIMTEMMGQGLSMGLMSSIVNIGTVTLQSGINGLGYLVIAGHTAARKLFSFCSLPFGCMATALSTFVSQNRGADQGKRIRQSIRFVMYFSLITTVLVSSIMYVACPAMTAWISGSSEPVVLNNAVTYIRCSTPFYFPLGILISLRCALQGLGQKLLPLVSSGIEMVGKIFFTIFLIPVYGYTAVIFCEPFLWCCMVLQLLWAFYRNPYIQAAK